MLSNEIKVYAGGDMIYRSTAPSGSNFMDHLVQVAEGIRDIVPLGEPMKDVVYCIIPSAWGGISILSPNIAKAMFFDKSDEWICVPFFHDHEDWCAFKSANSSIYVVGDFDYYLAFAV